MSSIEQQFVSALKSAYCQKLISFSESGYKILMENEMYQEVDFEILFTHVEKLCVKLSRIFQMHLPYLTLKSKQIHIKKFLQTGIIQEIWKPGSLDIFVECIMERFLEVTPWIPNHLRDKLAWNVSWQHWLHALFNANMKTNPLPRPVNKKIAACMLEIKNNTVVEWNAAKIWHLSGIKVRSNNSGSISPNTPNSLTSPILHSSFDWHYYVNKNSDVETYGWRVFENAEDAESIVTNCDMKLILEGERRLMIDQWMQEEVKKRRKGDTALISGESGKKSNGYTRDEVSKHYRNGKYTLEFGKKTSSQSFHEVFYGDKLMDLKFSKLGFRR